MTNFIEFSEEQLSLPKMTYDELQRPLTAPVQRNHEKRAKEPKNQEKLSVLEPWHTIVWTSKLTRDAYDPLSGKTYRAGDEFLVDGNMRREFWKKYARNGVPKYVYFMRVFADTMEEVRDHYYSHDASLNTEKSVDLAFGATRFLEYKLTPKLYKVMPITWASHFTSKEEFPKVSGFDGPPMINAYRLWKDELVFLDSIKWDKCIQASMICSALMFLKANEMSQNSKDIVTRLFTDGYTGKDANNNPDAVTHMLKWVQNGNKEEWQHNYITMPKHVERMLYWMCQAKKELNGTAHVQHGGGGSIVKTPVTDEVVQTIRNLRLLKQAS